MARGGVVGLGFPLEIATIMSAFQFLNEWTGTPCRLRRSIILPFNSISTTSAEVLRQSSRTNDIHLKRDSLRRCWPPAIVRRRNVPRRMTQRYVNRARAPFRGLGTGKFGLGRRPGAPRQPTQRRDAQPDSRMAIVWSRPMLSSVSITPAVGGMCLADDVGRKNGSNPALKAIYGHPRSR